VSGRNTLSKLSRLFSVTLFYREMNTLEIGSVLQTDPFTCCLFGGVFAADRLPVKVSRPSLFIVNSDKASKPGEHWLAIYFPQRGPAEYFDSYGMRPFVRDHLNFIERNSVRWIHNDKKLQGWGSLVCGQYCIMYALFRSRGVSMERYCSLFSTENPEMNDRIVSKMLNAYVKKRNCVNYFSHCIQCCCARASN